MHLGKPQKCSRKIGSQSKKESSSERQMAKAPPPGEAGSYSPVHAWVFPTPKLQLVVKKTVRARGRGLVEALQVGSEVNSGQRTDSRAAFLILWIETSLGVQ